MQDTLGIRRIKRTLSLILDRRSLRCMIFLIGLALGCGSPLMQKSPSDVVKAAYLAANEARYTEFESYLSSEALAMSKTPAAVMSGGIKGALDKVTRNGTIVRIEILKEEIRGEGAKVQYKFHFKDGSTEESDDTLVLQKGLWKMTIE